MAAAAPRASRRSRARRSRAYLFDDERCRRAGQRLRRHALAGDPRPGARPARRRLHLERHHGRRRRRRGRPTPDSDRAGRHRRGHGAGRRPQPPRAARPRRPRKPAASARPRRLRRCGELVRPRRRRLRARRPGAAGHRRHDRHASGRARTTAAPRSSTRFKPGVGLVVELARPAEVDAVVRALDPTRATRCRGLHVGGGHSPTGLADWTQVVEATRCTTRQSASSCAAAAGPPRAPVVHEALAHGGQRPLRRRGQRGAGDRPAGAAPRGRDHGHRRRGDRRRRDRRPATDGATGTGRRAAPQDTAGGAPRRGRAASVGPAYKGRTSPLYGRAHRPKRTAPTFPRSPIRGINHLADPGRPARF